MRDNKSHQRPTNKPIEPAGRPVKTLKDRDEWLRALAATGDLSVTVRLIGMRIGLYHHIRTGQCNPGYVTLCKELSVFKSTVIRAVAILENAGWFVVLRSRGGQWSNANEYQLRIPAHRVAPPLPVRVALGRPVRVAGEHRYGSQGSARTGSPSATQTENRTEKGEQRESDPPVRFADDDEETLPGDRWVASVGRRYAAKRRGDG
jgi:Helix-turn-helix domain